MIRKISLFLCFVLLIVIGAVPAMASNETGVFYRHARIFGKPIHYDQVRDLLIVYGSFMIPSPEGWKVIESKKFHYTHPGYHTLRQKMIDSVGDEKLAIAMEGKMNLWPGQKEEVMEVELVNFNNNYPIETEEWHGFGLTIKTEQSYITDLGTSMVLMNNLVDLAKSTSVPQDGRITGKEIESTADKMINPSLDDKNYAKRVATILNSSWDRKWFVVKDDEAANMLRSGVGGWQFYHGLKGSSNYYIESASSTRNHIDEFMNAVVPGGFTPENEGSAIICAYLKVSRDEYGEIVKVNASGALYDEISDLYMGLEDTTPNKQTWRLEGWSKKDIELMEGELNWLIGRRVIEYDEYGNIADQYFFMSDYLTRDGFNNTLSLIGEVIRKGGVSG